MALQLSYQTNFGFIANKAYAHIDRWKGDKTSITCDLSIFNSQSDYTVGKQAVGIICIQLELADGATMQQMYDALKLQEPFIGAVDI